jgi:hypothetical protein
LIDCVREPGGGRARDVWREGQLEPGGQAEQLVIIGYDMFRNLTNEKNKKFKAKQRNVFNQ